jgi:RNA polymerase sigma-70 factor (ECF subfamily)
MSEYDSAKSRFTSLVQEHFSALYGAARRLTSSPSDAEDLVQDVCLKAFESIDELERIEFRRAWLLKVIRSNLNKSPGARSGLTNSWTRTPGLPR